MRNYPAIIKNLKLFEIDKELLDENSFVLKGQIDNDHNNLCIEYADGQKREFNNTEHNVHNFLPNKQRNQLIKLSTNLENAINKKFNGISMRIVLEMVILYLVHPCFDFTYCSFLTGLYSFDIYRAIRFTNLAKNLENDQWFMNNGDEVDEELHRNEALYDKLSSKSKQILARDASLGTISLNNIEEFPNGDLRLIRKTITTREKKNEKVLKKEKRRGM